MDDMDEFVNKTKEISEIYINAVESEAQNIHVYSTDEKMGIHAREHKNPSIAMKEGQVERIDPEYIRHGTSGMIASRNVATGEIIAKVQPTRTEEDYAGHIKNIYGRNPGDKHLFVNDNLNTHKSEALVLLIAEIEGISPSDLGKKGFSGILHRCVNTHCRRESQSFAGASIIAGTVHSEDVVGQVISRSVVIQIIESGRIDAAQVVNQGRGIVKLGNPASHISHLEAQQVRCVGSGIERVVIITISEGIVAIGIPIRP